MSDNSLHDVQEKSPTETTIQQAAVALSRMKAKLKEAQNKHSQPIAIVGMGARFPGGVTDADSYWQLLLNGIDAVREVPQERWSVDQYYDADLETPGKINAKYGAFLEAVDRFDPQHFGISPHEATGMDPQQRILLEVTWQALEDAGLAPLGMKGSKTGVYVGISLNDYAQLKLNGPDPRRVEAYDGTGNGSCFAAGRISHVFGLRGPSLSLDTACSSSLTAIHTACRDLRLGDCDTALAGGVQVSLNPRVGIFLAKARALAPDGKCKTFDSSADGFGRGEGCGVLVLKRLSDAVRENCNILAVIRGSAVNHDGHSSGLTVPSQNAQESVIRQALDNAQMAPDDIDYIEAHGTGTKLGDPIEMGALAAVFGNKRPRPLWVGSVKTNFGHAEAASGVAGLMKIVLSLQHKKIPPHLHFKTPNPKIPWKTLAVKIPTQAVNWSKGQGKRRAGVSAFGMNGTNVHILVEEAQKSRTIDSSRSQSHYLLLLSARTKASLGYLANSYQQFITKQPDTNLRDFTYTAIKGRSLFGHRAGLIFKNTEELRGQLEALKQGNEHQHVVRGKAHKKTHITFAFSNLGTEYAGMGQELYAQEPVFRQTIEQCTTLLAEDGIDLIDLLYKQTTDTNALRPIAFAYPALFALQVALVDLFKSRGVSPALVVGHEMGELAAAYAAGVFTLADGLKLATAKGRLLNDCQSATAVEGSTPCPMQSALDEFAKVAQGIAYRSPQLTFISSIRGIRADGPVATPGYWIDHGITPARLEQTAHALAQEKIEICIEVGPDLTLPALFQKLGDPMPTWLASLEKNTHAVYRFCETLAHLFVQGVPIKAAEGALLSLPTYPFDRKPYWVDFVAEPQEMIGGHPLTGRRIHSALRSILFEGRISQAQPNCLADHVINGAAILPAAGFIEMVLEAGAQLLGSQNLTLRNVAFRKALLLPEDSAPMATNTILEPSLNEQYTFQIAGCNYGQSDWQVYAVGELEAGSAKPTPIELPDWDDVAYEQIDVSAYYQRLRDELQTDYGPSFRAIERLARRPGEASALICLPAVRELQDYQLHPVLLDACFQLLPATVEDDGWEHAYLPIGAEQINVYRQPGRFVRALAQMHPVKEVNQQTLLADVQMTDEHGMLIAKIKSLSLMRTRLDSLQSKSMHPAGEMLHKIEWEPYTPAPLKTQAPGRLMILSDTKKGIGEKWAAAIKEAILVTPAKAYACIDQNHFTLDPGQPEHFKKLLAACDGLYPLHIVHFWSLDADSRDWERARQLCCESVVNLLKAIETAPQASLTLITQAATPATAGDFNAVQAMSLGLGKVITLEYPRLNCKMLDLDAQGPTPDAQQLSQVIHSSGGENMLAFRNNQFCVPRIHRLRPSQDSIRFSNEKAYLITGGFGGLGIETAKWLAAGNAGQIILVGRSQANPSAQAAIDSLTANGTQIICFQADIANETDVKNILQQIQANCLPLAGIVHAAGLNEDAMLVQQSADSLRRVMAPKVVGTWHLHRLTQTLDLDFFVCFSSAASITGVEGQGNYAAANAFMDALMHQRHSQGRKALTINWGPWAQVGMAARMHEEAQQRFADRGIGAILAKDALSLMARLLTQDIPQAMVAQIDWSKFALRLPMPLPLLNHLICDTQPAASAKQISARQVLAASGEKRAKLLLEYVKSRIGAVLKMAPDELADHDNINDMGLDSIMAVDLRNDINTTLNIDVPILMLMEGFCPEELAQAILKMLGSPQVESQTKPQALDLSEALQSGRVGELLTAMESLSDAEVEKMLESLGME